MKALGLLTVLFAMAISAYLMLGQRAPGEAGPTAVQAKHLEDKARDASALAAQVQLQSVVRSFEAAEGRLPKSLDELKEKSYVDRIPAGLDYDAASGTVSLAP